MSKSTFWIGSDHPGDPCNTYTVGLAGFLVEHSNAVRGWTRYELRDHPAQTNRSFKPRVWGWCGTDNDVGTYGAGIARVERIARNGRALVKVLSGAEAVAVLNDLGYPELADDVDEPEARHAG